MRICSLGIVVAAITVCLSSAKGETYNKGTLNIKCTCEIGDMENHEWNHLKEIDEDGTDVDLADECRDTAERYTAGDICMGNYEGSEYAFDEASD